MSKARRKPSAWIPRFLELIGAGVTPTEARRKLGVTKAELDAVLKRKDVQEKLAVAKEHALATSEETRVARFFEALERNISLKSALLHAGLSPSWLLKRQRESAEFRQLVRDMVSMHSAVAATHVMSLALELAEQGDSRVIAGLLKHFAQVHAATMKAERDAGD